MKNILVVDTAAEIGGALTILESFYEAVIKEYPDNNWFFLVSKPELENTENVTVLKFPWTKKTKLHRLFFDLCIIPRIIKKLGIDCIISLQNIPVHTKKPQIVYVHQSIPFTDYRFSFRSDKSLWFIQNILKISICRGIKNANKVIVQSEWMKDSCARITGAKKEKFIVLPPEVNADRIRPFRNKNIAVNRFFYPAIGKEYKNHKVILMACQILAKKGISDYRVEFTLNPDENSYTKKIYEIAKRYKLNIDFCGRLDTEGMRKRYENSVLLFPSFLETVGLPLKEAMAAGDIILSGDCPYAHEAVGKYKNAYFFPCNDAEILADYMKKCVENAIRYYECDDLAIGKTSWQPVFEELSCM